MANGYLTPWRSGSLGRSPFGGGSLFDLHRQVNRLFDDLIERPAGSAGAPTLAATGWPQLEIDQQDNEIRVVAELPGVDENDVELTIEDGVLSLTGEKRNERKDESGYSERSYGRFERRIALPSNIEEDKCQADFKHGVLTVTIPRAAEKARGRRIPLGQGGQQSGQQGGRRFDAANEPESMPRQQAAEESRRQERPDEGQQG